MVGYVERGLKTRLVLPFAVSAEDRIKAITKDMEMATIFYLAESSREKGEGHILRKTDEKLVFIAEACYPMWFVPWGGATLLFDGLGVTSHTFSYDRLPSVKAFNKDMRRSAKTSRAYSTALSRNANYFKGFAGKEEETIEGLVTSPDFIKDFLLYRPKVEKTEKRSARKVVLSPLLNRSEISVSVKDLMDLGARIDEDVEDLDASMRLLSMTTREKVRAIREETQEIRKKFDKRIGKAKARVTKKIRRIQERHDKKIKRMSRRCERQLRLLHKNQVKLEKMQKRLKREIRSYKAKIRSCKRRKNKRSEIRWTRKLQKTRKKMPTSEKKIKEIERKIGNLETARNREISKKRVECDARIEKSMKVLRELEASREATIRTKQPETTSMDEKSSSIINQINELAKSKKAASNNFDRIGIAKRKKRRTLVYLPFYFVRYEKESKKRYGIYPPSIVSGMGILARMKGALGATKVKCFLQPRSKAMTAFLDQLITLIQKNPMFEKEVTEAGIQDSILRTNKSRLGLKRGLKELEKEKWISKNELQTLSKLLFMYAPSARKHKKIRMKLPSERSRKKMKVKPAALA